MISFISLCKMLYLLIMPRVKKSGAMNSFGRLGEDIRLKIMS